MFKKLNMKRFAVVGIFATVMMTTLVVFASTGVRKNISVVYNNIKLVVEGRPADCGKDSSGNKIEPFIYEGTTYLPVKAVGDALGQKVQWDGETQTVSVGEAPTPKEVGAQYITEVLQGVMNGGTTIRLNDKHQFNMGGKMYETGFMTDLHGDFIYFNLDSQYTEVKGEIASLDSNSEFNDILVCLDGEVYETITIAGNQASKKFTIPVSGVNELKFLVDNGSRGFWDFGLGDITIK